jgi:hypothetical protein
MREGTAPMRDIESDTYFLSLAIRCRKASMNCGDILAQQELRKLAEEFTAKADELARKHYYHNA